MQAFYKGRTNNHLTWVMVDATDFATPESALSAATKIKIYGKLRGGTGVNFVSSGTGSLTNDIVHVGASATGIYTIALAKADLSDASAAWYDQYVINLSATGAAYQTLVVDGGIDDSAILAFSDMISNAYSAAVQANSRVILVQSRLSDLDSRLASELSDVISGVTALSGLVSDAHSAANVGNSRILLVQSRLSDLDSRLASELSDVISGIVALSALVSDAHSDLKSAIANVSVTLTASDISDIASAVVVGVGSDMSDIYSLLSDLNSNILSRVPKEVASKSLLSDVHSDLRSQVGGITASVGASDISDIASAVRATLVSDLSDILSAAQQTNSRVLLNQSRISDIQSVLSDFQSDFQSRVPKAVATNSQLSDLHSDLRSHIVVTSGVISDLYSAVSDFQSDFQSRVPKAVATNSQLSDLHSDLRSYVVGLSGTISDIYSAVSDMQSDLQSRVPGANTIRKNVALSNFMFLMVDSTDHITPKTGLTITATRSIDGAAFGACANSASEVANGMYKINLAAGDLNGDVITLRFTATGADDRLITIVTQP